MYTKANVHVIELQLSNVKECGIEYFLIEDEHLRSQEQAKVDANTWCQHSQISIKHIQRILEI